MKKRKVIGWLLFLWGAVNCVVAAAFWLPYGWDLWHSAAHNTAHFDYAVINIIGCIVFMIGGWRLKRSARVKADA